MQRSLTATSLLSLVLVGRRRKDNNTAADVKTRHRDIYLNTCGAK